MEIRERVRAYINQNLTAYHGETFSDEDNIFNLGFVNSLFAMKLLTFIESSFDITIEFEEMELSNFTSVENIDRFITQKIAKGGKAHV